MFVKEMAYHAEPFISDSFLESINNTFLIRDPRLSIPSLHRMRADYMEPETGFEGQLKLLRRVEDLTGKTPFVMDGEDLRRCAQPIVREYFSYIRESMPPDILHWPVGSRPEWASRESWHLRAISSEGFEEPADEIDLSQLPGKVIRSVAKNQPYYEQMKGYVEGPDA